jgi:hypothetical protein
MRKVFIIVVLLLLFFSVTVILYQFAPPSLAQTPGEPFVIVPGVSNDDIIERLEANGFVKNQWTLNLAFMLHGEKTQIEPGEYLFSKSMSVNEVYDILHQTPYRRWIQVPELESTQKLGDYFGHELNWSTEATTNFITSYRKKVLERFKNETLEVFAKEYAWKDLDKQAAEKFYDSVNYDLFVHTYIPGVFLIPTNGDGADAAVSFFEQAGKLNPEKDIAVDNFAEHGADEFSKTVRNDVELLPDIVPLPARDIKLVTIGGRTLLIFSTAYWNKGKGPLELLADPETKGIPGDIERNIYQRVYRIDGTHRDRLAGTFLWHQIHLHYHYSDFVDYVIEIVDTNSGVPQVKRKATFCVRDMKFIEKLDKTPKQPNYTICGKERQGVSVGWGDEYDYTLADQSLDVTNIPKGLYRLMFRVNPRNRFDELDTDNNISRVLLQIDPAKKSVQVFKDEDVPEIKL